MYERKHRSDKRASTVYRGAFLLVGVVGVGISALIAPASGEHTCDNITDKVSDFGDKIQERVEKGLQPGLGVRSLG